MLFRSIACFIYAILLMLSIFRTRPLDQAFNVIKYVSLREKTYRDILLFEIDANSHSYVLNKKITERDSKRYSNGVNLMIVALLCSIVLITANKFIKIEKQPTKVQVVNVKKSVNGSPTDSINAIQIATQKSSIKH